MTKTKTIDLDALLEAACDLESGHAVEAVLAKYGVPDNWSAYDFTLWYYQISAAPKTSKPKSVAERLTAEYQYCVAEIAECLGVGND